MNKFGSLISVFSFLGAPNIISAQNPHFETKSKKQFKISQTRATVQLNSGFSVVGSFFDNVEYSNGISGFRIKSTPALQSTFDYLIWKKISIGIGASIQKISGSYRLRKNAVYPSQKAELTYKHIRSHAYSRVNLNFADKGKFNFYTGIKFGVIFNRFSTSGDSREEDIPNVKILQRTGFSTRYSVGVTPIGLRFFPRKNLGLNAEFSIGAPHFLSAGVSFRF